MHQASAKPHDSIFIPGNADLAQTHTRSHIQVNLNSLLHAALFILRILESAPLSYLDLSRYRIRNTLSNAIVDDIVQHKVQMITIKPQTAPSMKC